MVCEWGSEVEMGNIEVIDEEIVGVSLGVAGHG